MKEIIIPRSIRKYIRREKARIRRDFLTREKQKEEINELYARFIEKSKEKQEVSQSVKQ